MTPHHLRTRLRSLGIDERTWRTVALLPLVEVAWADGRVQDAERARILALAHASGALSGDGRLLVEGWLKWRPSEGTFSLGREVLRALSERLADEGIETGDILSGCEAVARAAGGLFGVVGAIDASERSLLAEIADELHTSGPWEGLLDGLDEAAESWEDDDPTLFYEPSERRTDPGATPASDAEDGALQRPFVAVSADTGAPQRLALRDGLRVGRSAGNDLVLNADGRVSRRHCQFYEQEGRWYVVDAGSVNGTWVGGERVLERRLFDRDRLRLGDTELVVRL